jgi:hypothetical protein
MKTPSKDLILWGAIGIGGYLLFKHLFSTTPGAPAPAEGDE